MRRFMIGRGTLAGLALLATFGVAACSQNSAPTSAGSGNGRSTTPVATAVATAPATTTPGTTTPAVIIANGIEMTVSSTPRAGELGTTTIDATVNLTGAVPAGTLDFLVGIGPANQGQPYSDEQLAITGPGTYQMPSGYTPTQRGAWALTVVFSNQQGTIISATGMAATATSSVPYPQLVTVVS